MFGVILKIVRALLGALALTLLGVGSHAPGPEHPERGEARLARSGANRVKSAPIIAARAGGAGLSAPVVAQAGTARTTAPAVEVFFGFPAPRGRETKLVKTRPEAVPRRSRRARPGVVRLLI